MARKKYKAHSKNKTNRRYKDTLFRLIFEQKEYALALYNAVNHTDYTDIENLRVITLKDAMYINVKNDVGYIFHDIMSFFEQQSSYNPNMPLRGLGYISDSLKEYLAEIYGDQKELFSGSLIHIPTPRYYVFYNGTLSQPEVQELKLSEAYDGKGDVEVIAHMLNINKGYNKQLMEACKPLSDYSELVDRVRCNKAAGMPDKEAVDEAVDSCIEDGILVNVLRKERARVKNILYAGLTKKQEKELIELQKQRAIEAAVKEAVEKNTAEVQLAHKIKTVDNLVEQNILTLDKACDFMKLPVEEYLKYKQN